MAYPRTHEPCVPTPPTATSRSWTPHRVRVTRLCSFFSAARRTNQEAPPLLSGYLARRLAPPSGAAELAALKQSSPLFLNRLADKGGGIATLHRKCPGHFAVRYPKIYRPISSFRAATRNPGVPARDYVNKSPTYSLWAPHHVRGDTMRIGDGEALSSFRAATRNPGIPARYNSGRTNRASLLLPLPPPEAGPRIEVRGDTVRIGVQVTQRPHRMQSGSPSLKKIHPRIKKYSGIFGLYYKPIYICITNIP